MEAFHACAQCSSDDGPQTLFILMSVMFSVYVALDCFFTFLVISRKASEPALQQSKTPVADANASANSTSYERWLGPGVTDLDAHLKLRKP